MNRIKLTIKDFNNETIFRMESTIIPAKSEYTNIEVSEILQALSEMIKYELKRDIVKTHNQLEFNFV